MLPIDGLDERGLLLSFLGLGFSLAMFSYLP
jgi:hypothetical protein